MCPLLLLSTCPIGKNTEGLQFTIGQLVADISVVVQGYSIRWRYSLHCSSQGNAEQKPVESGVSNTRFTTGSSTYSS